MSKYKEDTQSDVAIAEKEKLAEPSNYNVIVHNNDHTSYDEVIIILSQAFQMSNAEALNIAQKVDCEGKGVCGTYSKEVADMKLMIVDTVKKQLIQFMPTRVREISMLKFTVEKA